MEERDIAWLAGLFEGEGCISFTSKRTVQIRIVSTDKDVVESVDRLVPSPNGIRSYAPKPNRKQQWVWVISKREVNQDFLNQILPYLHSRRRARALEALEALALNWGKAQERTHCPRGHPLSGDNVYSHGSGHRQCRQCMRDNDARRRPPKNKR
jgi:hypothetical protein